ncbi:MAG: hypothetical protein EPN41_02010 [Candidimonas sp.]|nr:MAG: hypothetical protein EPN41_02010 [Candidimonas sp.]
MDSGDRDVPFDDARIRELKEKYAPILNEIKKLREVELKEVHPAIFFDPAIAYGRREGGRNG